jgi:hypothetical protein
VFAAQFSGFALPDYFHIGVVGRIPRLFATCNMALKNSWLFEFSAEPCVSFVGHLSSSLTEMLREMYPSSSLVQMASSLLVAMNLMTSASVSVRDKYLFGSSIGISYEKDPIP